MSDQTALEEQTNGELRSDAYELFMAALSVLSIVNLALLYLIDDPSMNYVLGAINLILTCIFLFDFFVRLKAARSKSTYFFREFGWADLLASLPFQQAKILRLFRLVKVVRLVREKGAKNLGRSILQSRAESALLTLLLVGILMLEFGSLGMLALEQDAPQANITSASDALWYVIVTMSTVGYGDQYPITNPGRALGTAVILIGVGIFGAFTGYLANVFLTPLRKKREADAPPDDLQARLATLKDLAAQQQAAIAELESLVNRPGSPPG